MAYTFYRSSTLELGSEVFEIEFEIDVGSWGCAGVYSGPPESCYPGEAPEIWIIGAFRPAPAWAKDRYPHNELRVALTDAERWSIEEWCICHAPPEQDYDDYDDYDD